MQGINDQIQAAGATLIALTPQLPEHSLTMVERHKLGFDLLSDPGNRYAAELGIRFELPEYLKTVYQRLGLDLEKHSGVDDWSLPMPGRLLADSTGTVRATAFDPDYTRRPEPEEVLADLANL